ncbi:hypothetical protein [Aquimonas voraii]|uniref:Uncharacterized protein n=1 Tax=Aquimonas voraii TaxID=265719 RepID=A0A1G6XCE8_9GAMM|nr:hypothetical protein [Aquimonas voraii]SDD75894.1 hypothetical protein SAMN04488509_106164 [Aquimonas voraii]
MPNLKLPALRFSRLALFAIGLGAAGAAAHAAVPEPGTGARLLRYAGEARAPDSGALIYVEEHLLRELAGQPVERLVLYRCADGTPFARKQVEYGTPPFAPAFELVDARLDYREGLRREGGDWIVFGGAGERAHQTPLEEIGSIVADAGFEPFVRQHWAQLQAGESVGIDFLVPSRARSYGFRLSKVEALEIDGEAASRMRLALSGMFGLFAPPIDVIYRDADQWLLRFEGMTNIRESARENVVAHIAFPQTPQPVAADAWAQASAESLQSCALPAAG